MACDLQFTNTATGNKWKGHTKVYKFQPHENTYPVCEFIVGFAGAASEIVTIAEFFSVPDNFSKPPKVGKCLGLVLTAKKQIFMFTDYCKWLAVKEPYHAIGSGSEYALGAMASGMSPKEAVKIAMKHDSYTGMGIKTINF